MLTLIEQGTVEQIDRMMTALFEMPKLDVAALESAFYRL